MHFTDRHAEVHRKTKCHIIILYKQLTSVVIKLWGDVFLTRDFSLLYWGVIAGHFLEIDICFGAHLSY